MTDKQIIIDEEGKDCAFYANGKCTCSDFCLASYCADAPLCIYKLWLRKEQECEELKEKCKKYWEINEQETKDYAELKAENEELTSKCSQLKQTLTEIKEIAYELTNEEYTDFIEGKQKQILQKINEVE